MNDTNNEKTLIDVDTTNVTSVSSEIEYSDTHYLTLILIYFVTMYFGASIAQILVMFSYNIFYDLPTSYVNSDGLTVFTQHYQDYVNLWTQIGVYTIIFIVLVYLLRKVFVHDLIRSKNNVKLTLKKAALGIAYVYIASFICNFILNLLNVVDQSENQNAIVDMLGSSQKMAVLIYCLILVVVAPIVEELIFRKAMFGFLRKFNMTNTLKIVISGILFGGIHVATSILVMILERAPGSEILTEMLLGIPYIVMGFVLGYIYSESKENVVVPTLVHMFNNGLSVIANLMLINMQ